MSRSLRPPEVWAAFLFGGEMIQTGLFTSRWDIEEAAGLAEGLDDEKGELTVMVIRPGFNAARKRFYPADTLRRDYRVFEGAKMFADHATVAEEKDGPRAPCAAGWAASRSFGLNPMAR
jgi:hypothetical protein